MINTFMANAMGLPGQLKRVLFGCFSDNVKWHMILRIYARCSKYL